MSERAESGKSHRSRTFPHPGLVAAMVHRMSGLALVVFLPAHFLALGLALDRARFSDFIAWSNAPLVKFSEFVLVSALAVHFAGGIRVLAIEFLGSPPLAATWIAVSLGTGTGIAILFLLSAFI